MLVGSLLTCREETFARDRGCVAWEDIEGYLRKGGIQRSVVLQYY
jgi:hypothetical protein